MSDDLLALSPLDGRYRSETEALREHFSEFAYIRERVRIEIAYLIALGRDIHLVREPTSNELDLLKNLSDSFSPEDAQQVKELERVTRHDVKAIEHFLRSKLAAISQSDLLETIHFGLTSEDVNNIAQAIALREARDQIIIPALNKILNPLAELIKAHKSTLMPARTHGQTAVPTTFGKEMAVFYARLKKQAARMADHRFEAKLNGAVGNFNAVRATAPQVDWMAFSEKFIRELGLEPNPVTTQTLPYENWIEYFNMLHSINSILIDFAQDMWRYASDDYLKLKVVVSETGSSTMPQKINPIDFENAEGNLGIANALFEHYARKLPISRLQRDLSDSTVRRTFGTALGHTLTAYASLAKALERIEANEAVMKRELENHWETIAEGAQTILRAAGLNNAYEQLKSITRGKEITKETFQQWIEGLEIEPAVKEKLRALSPLTYSGLAEEIVIKTLNTKDAKYTKEKDS